MNQTRRTCVLGWVACIALAACSAGGNDTSTPGTGGNGSTGGSAGSDASVPDVNEDSDDWCYSTDPHADFDGDGYTIAQGDCNDCHPNVNPGAYDFPGNGVDEDCDGKVDNEPLDCDKEFPGEGWDPVEAARSLGLCRFPAEGATGSKRTWGVIGAKYVFADGSEASDAPYSSGEDCTAPEGFGGLGSAPNPWSYRVAEQFGVVKPRKGASMVILSTGIAEAGNFGDPKNGVRMCTKSPTPTGFPTPSSAACPEVIIDYTPVAHDPIALELKIRVPTNAKSFSFDFNFHTFEHPEYVCKRYNDFFVALLYSQHEDTPENRNISFDKLNNPVSVNNGFLEVCKGCSLGPGELAGTGFEGHGATGWLRTSAAVVPGEEIVLRFAIWDMGDNVMDSTVLIDNIQWVVDEGKGGTDRPVIW